MTASAQRWGRWAWHRLRDATAEPPPVGELPFGDISALRLEGLVHAALRAAGDLRAEPLRVEARKIVAANLIRPAAMTPALAALDRAGVRAVVFKGAATVEQFELLRGIRGVGDADLLVAPRQFGAARAALLAAGFEEQIASEPVSYWSNNERVFRGGEPTLELDLHRGLHRWPLFSRLSDAVVSSAVQAEHGWRADVQSTPLIAAAHRAKHGYTADARELLDVAAAFGTYDDAVFDDLANRAARFGISGALYALWTLVREWFGPTSDAESAAYRALRGSLGWRRPALDALLSMDRPTDANKPWRRHAFLKLYAPQPLLTDRWFAPAALAAAHVALRGADRLVAGPMAVEPSSRRS